MYTENNHSLVHYLAAILLLIFLPFSTGAKENLFNFTTAKGLKIKILKNDLMRFSHAELIIFHGDKNINPAIPVLTLENMFNKDINKTETPLLSILRRLGNDFEVINRQDYLKLKINFLSNRASLFAQLIKEIFNYKSFTLDKFKDSIDNYWGYFLKKDEWQRKIAFQIAYHELFPKHLLGNSIISPNALTDANFAQILVFYNDIYIPENSLLFVKGDVDPFLLYGHIQKSLRTYKKKSKPPPQEESISIPRPQKVIIFDTGTIDPPQIFWFETLPPLNTESHMKYRIINNILFGFPTGILFRTAGYFGMRNIKIETDIIHHHEVSVICNTVNRLSYKDIEKFILLVDGEKKKLRIKKIDRKEYLNARNFFFGKFKVDTDQFDSDLKDEILGTILNNNQSDPETAAPDIKNILTQISLDSVNKMIAQSKVVESNGENLRGSIIIIAGNEKMLRQHLNILKPDNMKIKIK